jgi:hypothetical protein
MKVCRITSAAVLFALCGLLAAIGVPAGAQEKKDKAKGKDALDETTTALMEVIEKAAKDKDYRKDPKHGNGSTPYDEAPAKPGFIIGFDLYPGVKGKTTQYVRGVRPVFLTSDGKTTLGTVHGWTSGIGAVREKAKAGYAVAGIKVHTDFGEISGLCVVFAKITETGLNMDDSYEGKYYGHKDPTTAKKVVCTGEPIVGVHGLVADSAKSHDFALGLIVMGKDPKKKP